MNIGFRRKQQDERVTNLQNKVYRELYMFVTIVAVLSLIIKTINDDRNIWTELIILIGGGVYYLIRVSSLGIFSDEVEMHDRSSKIKLNKKNFIVSLVVGIGFSLTLAIRNSQRYADSAGEEISFFLMIFFTCMAIYIPVMLGIIVVPYKLAKNKSDRVNDAQLDDDEDVR
ncbi:DUF6773 family protein [Halobacillus litoralis]|uniref:DUF3278 domain-containing protein n=1 Tax=Halobacillus litoralis TaxID=45668 RepID=A0A410M986_9BACI|nr:DUF6773 family protein [Halobacillus litoralis]QAS51301.1 hypothetical protein HLI_03270 [Halobacillus litoralis]